MEIGDDASLREHAFAGIDVAAWSECDCVDIAFGSIIGYMIESMVGSIPGWSAVVGLGGGRSSGRESAVGSTSSPLTEI